VRLVVIGDAAWDVLLRPERDLIWGADVFGAVQLCPGGSAANVAVWARRLGAQVRFVGKAGDDDLGRLLSAHFSREDVSELTIVPGALTTRVGVVVASTGERAFVLNHEDLFTFDRSDCPPSLADNADAVFFNGYGVFSSGSSAYLSDLLPSARERGVPLAFDPSSFEMVRRYGAERLLREIAPVDFVLANEEEAAALAGGRSVTTLLDVARWVVLKQGARGASVISREGSIVVNGRPTRVLDSTGAGDAFGAAFLTGWLRTGDLRQALDAGAWLGSFVCERHGAQPRYYASPDAPGQADD
jgi:sugar/nucleoside kinase (ribokinase family)